MKYTLDQVVREYIIETDSAEQKYFKFLQLGISGLRELNMDISGMPKVVELEINSDTDTVVLPQDFIDYTFIGVCGANGTLQSLGLNNKTCLPVGKNDCGSYVANKNKFPQGSGTTSVSSASWSDHYRNGQLVGKFYGLGGGNNSIGEYKINKAQGTILIGANSNISTIVLEYIADVESVDGDFIVHPYLIEAIKAYIYHKERAFNDKYPLGVKQLAERKYRDARRKVTARYMSFTKDEALQTIRKAIKLAPKS
jgi:hypothetical protein